VPPVAVKLTVPVGVVDPAPLVSATVAIHVVDWPVLSEFGVHETVVEVVRKVTVTVVLPLLPE
jgi:hypothetical protein